MAVWPPLLLLTATQADTLNQHPKVELHPASTTPQRLTQRLTQQHTPLPGMQQFYAVPSSKCC